MSQDVLSVELQITDAGADVVLSRTKQKLEDFIKTASTAQPQINFKIPNQNYIDLDKLEKRADLTRKSFEAISKIRLDSGQVNFLTKEIFAAHERAAQLFRDISSIKAELANPNRKSSVKFLTDELRAAETEAEKLNRKLNSLSDNHRPSGGRGLPGSQSLKLSSFQKTNLGYQINDVLTGLASGQNPAQILAQQGGQIAQIFSKEQIVEFAASYSGLVSILGLGTVAIGATYAITKNLRDEAERRLKAEEKIVGAVNQQILSQAEALKTQAELSRQAQSDFEFRQRLAKGGKDDLLRERDLLKQLNSGLPDFSFSVGKDGKLEKVVNENFKRNAARIQELENQLRQNGLTNTQKADAAFNQRNEDFKRAQEESRKKNEEDFRKSVENARKRFEDIEKAKVKVKELEKTYLDVSDNLFQKANSQNPFVALFSEADKSARALTETTRELSKDVISTFEQMEKKANNFRLLSLQIDTQLSAFNLRQDAQNFRDPFDSAKQKKEQDEFIERFLRNNPNYLYLEGKKEVDAATRAKILDRFAPSYLKETEKDRFNKRLTQEANLLYKPNQSVEQQAIADKRFISATSGFNPLDLTKDLREKAAVAREREAIRQERYQQDAIALYRQQSEYQKAIAANTLKQLEIAGKGGVKAIELTLKNDSNAAAELQPAANSADTADHYYSETDQNYRIGDVRKAGSLYRKGY